MTGILNALIAGVSGAVKDAYFNLVSLLLPGNGTNGAQNNTFLDSGTANSGSGFTITRNGNTTQGTFSPFSQTGWGNYFNGSSYLSTPGFNFSTSDFTIECFINSSSVAAGPQPIGGYASSGLNYTVALTSGGVYQFYLSSNGSTWDIASGVVLGTATAGKWHHIVIVRSGNSIRGYFDGTGGTTITSSAAIYNNSTAFYIGAAGSAGGNLTGYFSNVRVLLGTAAYNPASSTITVPTAPFATGTTNQVLLTCQANRFVDSNTATTAKTITVSGSPQVTPFSPFAPTQPYSAAAVGGSGYFDGTGDYLSVANNSAFQFGTGDFTIEFWLYARSSAAIQGFIASDTTGNWSTLMYLNNFIYGINSVADLLTTSYVGFFDQWTHVAVVRQSGTSRIYFNGAQRVSGSDSNNYNITTGNIDFGRDFDNAAYLFGYLANARIVKGVAVYTGAFTPPTKPLASSGADSASAYPSTTNVNTSFASSACSLLLNFTNAGVVDATAKNDLETVGNAQISTGAAKFGTTSIYFDGAGDYLIPNGATTDMYAFGTGNFTIEMWFRMNALAGSGAGYQLYDGRTSSIFTSPQIWIDNATPNYGVGGVGNRITGSPLSANTWYHIAITKSGSSTKMFIDGTQVGSTYTDSTTYTNAANRPIIGASGYSLGSESLNGYISNLRVTKGYARYTANFTPPTAPFPVQ